MRGRPGRRGAPGGVGGAGHVRSPLLFDVNGQAGRHGLRVREPPDALPCETHTEKRTSSPIFVRVAPRLAPGRRASRNSPDPSSMTREVAQASSPAEVAWASLAEPALGPRCASTVESPPWDADRAHGQACPCFTGWPARLRSPGHGTCRSSLRASVGVRPERPRDAGEDACATSGQARATSARGLLPIPRLGTFPLGGLPAERDPSPTANEARLWLLRSHGVSPRGRNRNLHEGKNKRCKLMSQAIESLPGQRR